MLESFHRLPKIISVIIALDGRKPSQSKPNF